MTKKVEETHKPGYGPIATVAVAIVTFFGAQLIGYLVFLLGLGMFAVTTGLVRSPDLIVHPDVLFATFKAAIKLQFDLADSGLFQQRPWTTFFQILCIEASVLVILYWFMRRRRISRRFIGLNRPQLSHILYAIGGFVAYLACYLIVVIVAKAVIPGLDLEKEQELGFSKATTGGNLIPIFMSLALLPPLVEEIVARGFLFSNLRVRTSFLVSAIVTSILFSAAHLGGAAEGLLWIAAIDTFVLSMVMCHVREKTGSLWPAIGMHFIKNTMAFYILFNLSTYLR